VADTAVSTFYQGDGFRLEAACTAEASSELTLRSLSTNGAFRVAEYDGGANWSEFGSVATQNNASYHIQAGMGWLWFLAPDGTYTSVQYSVLDNTNQSDCSIVGFVNAA
jgi:hypothetical protein